MQPCRRTPRQNRQTDVRYMLLVGTQRHRARCAASFRRSKDWWHVPRALTWQVHGMCAAEYRAAVASAAGSCDWSHMHHTSMPGSLRVADRQAGVRQAGKSFACALLEGLGWVLYVPMTRRFSANTSQVT